MSDFGLHGKKTRFIEELLLTGTISGASRAAGVTPRTGRRWMQDVRVRVALGKSTDAIYSELAIRASRMAGEALDVLRGIAKAEYQAKGASTRVRACQAILDMAVKLREQTDLQDRVAMLEERGIDNGKAT